MGIISIISLILIAVIHYYIFIVEAFFWNKPLGLKSFNLEKVFADKTKVIAINQGVYNAFLASGLIFSIVYGQKNTAVFFSLCVLIAGIVGGITANKKILFIQTMPAAIALILIILGV